MICFNKKAVALAKRDFRTGRRQFGAIPFRAGRLGELQVALITSLDTGRWIIPKGWADGDEGPSAASRESYEEAGLLGRVVTEPLVFYRYEKRHLQGATTRCAVSVHLLPVHEELSDWPERSQRQRRWLDADSFVKALQEPDLARVLQTVDWRGEMQLLV